MRRHPQVTILCGDATAMLPADGTLFYLFNPFDETVMTRFRDALAEVRGGADDGVRTRIAYLNHKALYLFEDDPRFAVTPLDDGALSFKAALVDLLPADPV